MTCSHSWLRLTDRGPHRAWLHGPSGPWPSLHGSVGHTGLSTGEIEDTSQWGPHLQSLLSLSSQDLPKHSPAVRDKASPSPAPVSREVAPVLTVVLTGR